MKNAILNLPTSSITAQDEGKVVQNGTLVNQTSLSITQNNTYDTTTKNQVVVNVPNTYVAADEGKVVSNGTLIAQGSNTVTENGTVDTTLISSLTVNVSGGGSNVYAFAQVFYHQGLICTATDGTTILTAPDTSGTWIVAIPNSGTWTFTIGQKQIQKQFNKYGESKKVLVSALYYESSDGKLAVLDYSSFVVWFFMGVTINSNLPTSDIDSSLQQFIPPVSTNVMAKAYSSELSSAWIGNVGPSTSSDNAFRLLTTDNHRYSSNIIWATLEIPVQSGTTVLNIDGGYVQDVGYVSPADYYSSH